MLVNRKQVVTFNPSKEIGTFENIRLVIFNEISKKVFQLTEIPANEEYRLSETILESHMRYLYKYQIYKDGGWIDETNYRTLRVERITNKGIKYLLYPNKESKYLVVGFQGISKTPGYNYVRTLKEVKATQLYIKDEYGTDLTTTSYYLGANGDRSIAQNTLELIESVRIQFNVKRENVICIGSSKGGFASLYFAYKKGYGHVVAGGPQIKLGTYLSKGKDANNIDPESFMPKILEYLVGKITDEKITTADQILFDEIKNNYYDPNVFIHVGKGEPHYKNHVLPFVEFAKDLNLKNVKVDLGNYDKHNDLIKYFPTLLKDEVKRITQSNEATT